MPNVLRRPTCISCPHNLHFTDFVPKKQYGVMMRCGDRFCTGGKKARRFQKRGDPKVFIPDWCPKRKSPCELRIYCFKSIEEQCLHTLLSSQLGKASSPPGFRYMLSVESHIDLTPYEFWKRCEYEPYEDLLGRSLQLYEVAEIDDGLEPVFFYMTEKGLVLAKHFDAGATRKNVKEDMI